MRNIFHEILLRYLESDQYEFHTSPRELWPQGRTSWHPQAPQVTASPAPERGRHHRVYRELEPQN